MAVVSKYVHKQKRDNYIHEEKQYKNTEPHKIESKFIAGTKVNSFQVCPHLHKEMKAYKH